LCKVVFRRVPTWFYIPAFNNLTETPFDPDNPEQQLRGNQTVPEISRFLGIVIAIYYKEHGTPHFHAKYSGETGVFSIADLRLIEGHLPRRIISLVLEWAFEHRDELLENWEFARANMPLRDIPPLD